MNYMGGTSVRQAFRRYITDSTTKRLYMASEGAVIRIANFRQYNADCTHKGK